MYIAVLVFKYCHKLVHSILSLNVSYIYSYIALPYLISFICVLFFLIISTGILLILLDFSESGFVVFFSCLFIFNFIFIYFLLFSWPYFCCFLTWRALLNFFQPFFFSNMSIWGYRFRLKHEISNIWLLLIYKQ